MRIALFALLAACAAPHVVVVTRPPPPPPPPPRVTMPRGPVMIVPRPFTPIAWTTTEAPLTIGTTRAIRELRTVGSLDEAYFEEPRRAVIGVGNRWRLVDPIEDRVIAEVGKPSSRMSRNEIVLGDRLESIVDLRDGTMLAPVPKLPIEAPLESMHIIHADEQGGGFFTVDGDEGGDVYVMATAAGRTFIGLWNDRALHPTLTWEIETPPGWLAHRRADGLELEIPAGKTCKGLRLYRTRAPECIESTFKYRAAITSSWEVSLENRVDRTRLVAHDIASGRDEIVDIPCAQAIIHRRSRSAPRVVVRCLDEGSHAIVAWVPGRAFTIDIPSGDSLPQFFVIGRFVPIVPNHDPSVPRLSGTRWLDLDAGTIAQTPRLAWLDKETGSRSVALEGKRIALIDAAAQSLRLADALSCPGEILAGKVAGDYVSLSCGVRAHPGVYDYSHEWSKIVDVRTGKLYSLPGYPAAMFEDGTVLVSNRARMYAETRGPQAKLTLIALD